MKKQELRNWRENYTPFTDICLGEGLKLNVHFDEKEYVKDLGARWHPDPSGKGGYWWMPVRQLSRQPDSNTPSVVNTFEQGESDTGGCSNGITVLKWLNDNKMLTDEIHGDLKPDACEAATAEVAPTIYALRMESENTLMQFLFFEEQNLVKVIGNQAPAWSTIADARALWNSLVETVDAKREKDSERYTHFSLDTQGA
tara:strand:- start:331 stop:927 length:597 start_codon:yes stop_codon:yes gene_type:complete